MDPMTTAARGRGGFTLVELLVALTVLSGVLMLAATAYGWFTSRWQHGQGRHHQAVTAVRLWDTVGHAFAGTADYYLPLGETGRVAPFFQGDPLEARLVTRGTASDPDGTALALLRFVAKGEGYDLEYWEWPFTGQYLYDWEAMGLDEPWRWVVARGVRRPALAYYGYADAETVAYLEEAGGKPPQRQWFESYHGERRGLLPELVRLSYQDADGGEHQRFFPLPSGDPAKPLLMSGGL